MCRGTEFRVPARYRKQPIILMYRVLNYPKFEMLHGVYPERSECVQTPS